MSRCKRDPKKYFFHDKNIESFLSTPNVRVSSDFVDTLANIASNASQVMYIGPNQSAQLLHRDANNWWEFVRATWPASPEITISAMIALGNMTAKNGATRVVPGSHREPSASAVHTLHCLA